MRPSGVITMARGLDPTRIGRPARRVPVLIGVTVPEPRLTTYAVRPSGVSAMASGSRPTGIGRPLRSALRSTGVTVPEPEFATNAVGCCASPLAAGRWKALPSLLAPSALLRRAGVARRENSAAALHEPRTAPPSAAARLDTAGFAVNTSLTGGA